MAPKAEFNFVLPLLVSGPVEVGRMIRELEGIDGALSQASIRSAQGGSGAVDLPHITHHMQQLIEINKLDLRDTKVREEVASYLHTVRQKAPVLHISFSAEPNATFVEKIMAWLRKEIHPQVLLTIGLEPNIGAGCVVRSTNKYFDFSLRQDFANKRDLLLGKLAPEPINVADALANATAQPQPAQPAVAAPVPAAVQTAREAVAAAPAQTAVQIPVSAPEPQEAVAA